MVFQSVRGGKEALANAAVDVLGLALMAGLACAMFLPIPVLAKLMPPSQRDVAHVARE